MPKSKNTVFSIIGVEILSDCSESIRKNLRIDYYPFCSKYDKERKPNTKYPLLDDFFGKNISICAIVGKNGSGKSSLLDIVYRIINNFAFVLVKKQRLRAAERLYFIDGVYADLYFVIGGTIGCLYCRGMSIGFSFDNKKYFFGGTNPFSSDFEDCNNIKNDKLVEIARYFFYTIVTNYSIQAFIDSDYKMEHSVRFDSGDKAGLDSSAIWLNSLFHKNDGYITPIVLNPYRDEGALDLRNEYKLTNYRLSAILIESKNNKKQFIDGYQLNNIEYKYTPLNIFIKFKKNGILDDFINEFVSITEDEEMCSSIILKEFDCPRTSSFLEKEPFIIAHMYIVYKSLSIASKYPSFNDYRSLGKTSNYKKKATEEQQKKLKYLIKDIKKDKSHITIKIRQTLHFLEIDLPKLKCNKTEFDFTYEEYIKALNIDHKIKGLSEIMEYLPPPFFDFDIKLDKVKDKMIVSESPILFQRMSSGEKQFIYMMSTLIYHIKNLLSIQQSTRIKYRNINLMLDEVEICFHPEYQCLFIDKLLRTIKRLHLTTYCSFNIIIATHSPFVLSDIPNCNVLYLEYGEIVDKSIFKETFGANIYDILHQSFFLGSFIGGFAEGKINHIIKIFDKYIGDKNKANKNIDKDRKECKSVIKLVGEPLIRNKLFEMYREVFGNYDEIEIAEERIRKKEKEITSEKERIERLKKE